MSSEELMTSQSSESATELGHNDQLDLHKAREGMLSYAELDARRRVGAAFVSSAASEEGSRLQPETQEPAEIAPHHRIMRVSEAVVRLRAVYDDKHISLSDEDALATSSMFLSQQSPNKDNHDLAA